MSIVSENQRSITENCYWFKGVLGFDREPISSNARQGCLSPCKNSGEKVNANDELALAA